MEFSFWSNRFWLNFINKNTGHNVIVIVIGFYAETYMGPCQTLVMELFCKIVKAFSRWIFTKKVRGVQRKFWYSQKVLKIIILYYILLLKSLWNYYTFFYSFISCTISPSSSVAFFCLFFFVFKNPVNRLNRLGNLNFLIPPP